jgi:hypothetical protein
MNYISTPIQKISKNYHTLQILRGSLYLLWGVSLSLLLLGISGVISNEHSQKKLRILSRSRKVNL